MRGGLGLLSVLLLTLIIGSGLTVLGSIYYPEWIIVYSGGDYSTLYAWSIKGDFYDEFVYTTVQLNNTTNGNLDFGILAYYPNGTIAWSFSLDISGIDIVGGCFPDPTSDYLMVAGYFWDWYYTNTWDGAVIRINRFNTSDWNGVVFNTGYQDYLYSVYVGGDGSIYAVGEYNNGSWYYGVVVRYNNYSFSTSKWVGYTTSRLNVTFYDAAIGPDGYLYVTGHTLYSYVDGSGNVYRIPVHQLIYKLDPVNLTIVNTTYIYLPTSQNYFNVVNTMKVGITTCEDGICVAGFYYDEATGDPANPTLGAFVAKYDTMFNLLWRRNISTTEHEAFHGIAADGAGNITVVGRTSNDYGSGLGNTYYHILDVVFNGNGDLVDAFIAGGDESDIAFDTTVDFNGKTYLAGIQYSTSLTFYNITSNITIASTPGPVVSGRQISITATQLPTATAAVITDEPIVEVAETEALEQSQYSSIKSISTNSLSIKSQPPIDTVITPQQASSNDTALIVSLGYYLTPIATPPVPILEPAAIAVIIAVSIISVYYGISKRREIK